MPFRRGGHLAGIWPPRGTIPLPPRGPSGTKPFHILVKHVLPILVGCFFELLQRIVMIKLLNLIDCFRTVIPQSVVEIIEFLPRPISLVTNLLVFNWDMDVEYTY